MINYNRNQFFILYDLLNDILDEVIQIKDTIHKVKSKLNHKLFIIGKEYNLINNSDFKEPKTIQNNRSKIIHIRKTNKALQEELESKGIIKIIFD
tara:strand:+ start:1244 stop:1528 length:285 start_codon:yes stop_codon:yes gene_type:complete